MPEKLGLLVMAYGTPQSLEEVPAYYTDIRRGRPPPAGLLDELIGRYEAIGGRSPLREITERQARGVSQRLGVPAYVGQKHATPFIPDAVAALAGAGVERAAGLVLAPHYSALSIGDYEERARSAAQAVSWGGRLDLIPSWHVEPGYVAWLAAAVEEARRSLRSEARASAPVIFSAHSLPRRILNAADPYADQLAATAAAVASRAGLENWGIGWQSAGRTEEPWIGPDILEVLDHLRSAGHDAAVLCPCGFVADHLEVLYDIDIEAQAHAHELGLELVRTAAPNDDAAFLDVLAGIVERTLKAA